MHRPLSLFASLLIAAGVCRAEDWMLSNHAALAAPAELGFSELHATNALGKDVVLWLVTFEPKVCTFAIMDNPDGAFDLGSAAEKRGALAATNGGYFQPDYTPLGLLVRHGAEIHPLEHARLLSGILQVTGGRIALQRTGAFTLSPAVRDAVQAGPFLIDRGVPITGLNSLKDAGRTVIIQEANGRFGVLTAKSATLAQMAEILATPSISPGGRIVRALNLDGGSSTALWVRGAPPFYEHEWKRVRDYVAIVRRPKD